MYIKGLSLLTNPQHPAMGPPVYIKGYNRFFPLITYICPLYISYIKWLWLVATTARQGPARGRRVHKGVQ